MNERDNVIETFELTKYYGKSIGIEKLSFEVKRGEIFGYLGPNGAGKTTTIRTLLGIIFPTSGSARILGYDILKDSLKIKNRVGYIPGNTVLYENLTGQEYLDFLVRTSKRTPSLRGEMLERFPVKLNRKIKELSFGNKRKLMIVGALQFENDILLMDEPTIGLDPVAQQVFYETLKFLKGRGASVFLSSHNLQEVERICDRVGLLFNGKLVAVENIEAIHSKKIKHIKITFKKMPDLKAITEAGCEILETAKNELSAKFKGDINSFLKTISELEIEDISILPSNLEDFFLEFYFLENRS